MTSLKQRSVTIGIAGAMALATMSSSFAAPVMSGAAVIKAAPANMTNVAWRGVGRGGFRGGLARGGFAHGGFAHGGFRGGRGAAIVAGVAAGAIAGAALANGYNGYGPYYGGPYYADPYYGDPDVAYDPGDAYGPGYGGPPVAYVAPGPNPGSCWVWTDPDRRFGYRRC